MSNYDYLGNKEKYHVYPLKIYLSSEDAVVIMYTGALYDEFYEIQNTTCVVSKNYFYKKIDELKKYNTTVIEDQGISITINLYENSCDIVIANSKASVNVVEKDTRFQHWLLSIDLRKSKRIETYIPISVESEFSFEYGAMIDMSESGFKICLNSKLNNMGKVILSIFDDVLPTGDIYCEVKHESYSNGKYFYGLSILNVSPEGSYRLKEILEREKSKYNR